MKKIFLIVVLVQFVFCLDTVKDYKICSRTEVLEENGKFLKLICIVGKLMSFEDADRTCKENQMKILDISESKVKSAFFIFFKNTFDIGISLWIDKRRPKSQPPSPTQSCFKASGTFNVTGTNCSEKNWIVCESSALSYKVGDENICAASEEISEGKNVKKTVCLVGKKMSRSEAESACKSKNMALLTLGNRNLEAAFQEKVAMQLGNDATFWIDEPVDELYCRATKFDGKLLLPETHPCDGKLMTYCEIDEPKPLFTGNKCANETVIYSSPTLIKSICVIRSEYNFQVSKAVCERNGQTLANFENSVIKDAFMTEARAVSDIPGLHLGLYWVDGEIGADGIWYTAGNVPMNHAYTLFREPNGTCLSYGVRILEFRGRLCDKKNFAFCSKATVPKLHNNAKLCARKRDFNSPTGTYVKSICEVLKLSNYFDAITSCRGEGMELFVVDSSETQSSLFKFARRDVNNNFWINGKRNDSGVWLSQNPEEALIFPGLIWSSRRSPAKCLSLVKNGRNFEAMAYSCTETAFFYCEFLNKV